MSALKRYEEQIKNRRSKTPFREFVKELVSWEVLNLYKNHGKISRYPDTGRVKTLDDAKFQNAADYQLDYDFSTDFFQNFQKLYEIVPFQYIMRFGHENENSDFADAVFGTKNAYLSFVSGFNTENTAYSAFVYINTTDVFNSFFVSTNASGVYSSGGVTQSHNVFYSRYISDSANVWFSTNLIGCEECIFCDGLQNQKYHIENVPYSKEEYFQKKREILKQKNQFPVWNSKVMKRYGKNFASKNVTGSYVVKCENVENSGWLVGIRNAKNSLIGIGNGDCENFSDCIDFGANSHDFYACVAVGNSSNNIYCSTQVDQCSHIYYGYFLQNCSFCIGCVGLKNQSYRILNKQYSKEEWHELAEKIFASMERDGTLGQFFPPSMNPFYFNDTVASLVYPDFTKEEVEKDGFLWRNEPIRSDIPENAEVISIAEISKYQGFNADGKWEINPDILKKTIQDSQKNAYRVVKMEYDFLVKHELPIPEKHWMDRIREGFRIL